MKALLKTKGVWTRISLESLDIFSNEFKLNDQKSTSEITQDLCCLRKLILKQTNLFSIIGRRLQREQ